MPAESVTTGGRVVRRIDHVAMAVDDARRVLDMLRDRLALDVINPVTELPVSMGYPVTSWLNLGNVPLEVLQLPDELKTPRGPLEVNGLVFEPEPIEAAVAELERRGIPHPPPNEFYYPEGLERPVPDLVPGPAVKPETGSRHGTQLWFEGLLGAKVLVLSYEWAAPVQAMRDTLRQRLAAAPDRPLAIDGVTEVVAGTSEFEAERERWQALLHPVTDDVPGVWRFDDGPDLRLVEHERDAIVGLTLRVADLERAERYLRGRDMLAASSGDELVVSPDSLDGLNLTLVA